MSNLPRVLKDEPEFRSAMPQDSIVAREEHKLCVQQAQFAMTRYMQMLALYAPLAALLLRELALATEPQLVLLWGILGSCLNGVVFYGARWFRSMAFHTLDRLALLADHLGVQRPHPMICGYRGGVVTFAIIELVVLGYTIRWFLVA